MLSKACCVVIFSFTFVLCFNELQIKHKHLFIKCSKFDLPLKSDLTKYLRALNRVITFSVEHENDIDINFYFGIFLANVNLKRVLKEKHLVLPKKLYAYVNEIIQKTEIILDVFKRMIDQNQNLRNNKYKRIFPLFVNSTSWINSLLTLKTKRFDEIIPHLDDDWTLYKTNVDDRNKWMPNPYQSDLCLTSLASTAQMPTGISRRCRVHKSCYDMVKNGTDFGYALAHRLLFLQQAKFACGCYVFSEQEDKDLKQRFCSAAYEEAEYIASHDFEIVDLLLEYVCLCALDGYAQFLKRSWLKTILNFQSPRGCFSPYSHINIRNIQPNHSLNVYCNGHTTAVAAGTLAIASRFILESYY